MFYRVFLVALSIFLTIMRVLQACVYATDSAKTDISGVFPFLSVVIFFGLTPNHSSLFSRVLGPLLCLQIDTFWHSKHDVSRNVRLSPPLRKQLLKPLRLHQRDARRLSERGASMNKLCTYAASYASTRR
jgi:hypothetical protein